MSGCNYFNSESIKSDCRNTKGVSKFLEQFNRIIIYYDNGQIEQKIFCSVLGYKKNYLKWLLKNIYREQMC